MYEGSFSTAPIETFPYVGEVRIGINPKSTVFLKNAIFDNTSKNIEYEKYKTYCTAYLHCFDYFLLGQ
jgi:hypothetical protein